jgi:hypothetical protein
MKKKIILIAIVMLIFGLILLQKPEQKEIAQPQSPITTQSKYPNKFTAQAQGKKPTLARETMSEEAFNDRASTEIVEFEAYGVTFRLPRNYIDDLLYLKQEHTFWFMFATAYPDFGGIVADWADEKGNRKIPKENFMSIYVKETPPPPVRNMM